MQRRLLLATLVGVSLSPRSSRSQSKSPPVIAVLGSGAATASSSRMQMILLEAGLREVGLVAGRDYVLGSRWAGSASSEFPALAAELLAEKPAAFVVSTNLAALAVQKLSPAVPIVGTGLNAPVASGLVSSLSRPGGSITGVSTMAEEVLAKLFEMTRETLPAAGRLVVMANPTNPSNPPMVATLKDLADKREIVIDTVDVRGPADLDGCFARIASAPPAALFVLTDNSLFGLADTIITRALALGVPSVGGFSSPFAQAGGLYAYGRDVREAFQGVARLLKKILAGAAPAELPFEQPTKFNLFINQKTAKALGIAVPPMLLAIADEIIE